MPVDATATRGRLLDSGARLFAEQGIHGAQIRDIVREAGQSNDSAVHYHFQSRDGLLRAICRRGIDEMEADRRARLAEHGVEPDLETVINNLIRPTARMLSTQPGRWFLRITAQLAGHAGMRSGSVPPPIVGDALRAQLEQLRARCGEWLPAALAGERIAIVIGALTSALAERAVAIDAGTTFALDEQQFADNLEAMLIAALRAPVPVPARS